MRASRKDEIPQVRRARSIGAECLGVSGVMGDAMRTGAIPLPVQHNQQERRKEGGWQDKNHKDCSLVHMPHVSRFDRGWWGSPTQGRHTKPPHFQFSVPAKPHVAIQSSYEQLQLGKVWSVEGGVWSNDVQAML
jgi:hypothetical protein